MYKVGNIEIDKAVMLAPMEDVTDLSYRIVCRELGADVVFTEFVNAEGTVRGTERTLKKMNVKEEERPVAIQIYGGRLEGMEEAAKIAEARNPDFIDINAGCWIRGVVNQGAGAGLLKDPERMEEMVKTVVNAVNLPVTVKTRLGMDKNNINILEIAKRVEDAGAAALAIHTRVRTQGNTGEADWSWIEKVKKVIDIPVVLNGNVKSAYDVKKAFEETGADGVMIGGAAIGNPWIFKETKELLNLGYIKDDITAEQKIKTCLRHLYLAIESKGERRAVLEHRKYYSGYLKFLKNASKVRSHMMTLYEYKPIEEYLLSYLEELKEYDTPFEVNYTPPGEKS